MKKKTIIIVIAVVIIVGLAVFGWMVRHQSTSSTRQSTTTNTQLPAGLYENKIKNTSTTQGLNFKSMLVENNVDSSGKPVGDHIELQLENTTDSTIQGIESYVTIADTKTAVKEGYFIPLTGLTIAPHQVATVNYNGDGNTFKLTKNSLYYTSSDSLSLSVEVSTPAYAVQTKTVIKAAGSAETKD